MLALRIFGKIIRKWRHLHVGKDQEDISFLGVGDPHLGSIQDIMVTLVFSLGLQTKSITSGTSLGKTEASDLVGCQLRKVSLLDILASILAEKSSN